MAADRVRDEAERLVAAALSMLSSATRGLGNTSGFATGSAECCVCPVCRTIAAMRDPNSDLADRLASGVGDLATGVAAIMRALASRAPRPPSAGPASETATADGEIWESLRRSAADAAKAYARPSTVDSAGSNVDDPWRAATRQPGPAAEPTAVPDAVVPRPTVAKKAVAKKAVAKKAVAKKAVAPAVDAPPAPAKRTVAKKAPRSAGAA